MTDEITKEIMRIYNCCEKRANEIIEHFHIDSQQKLENHITMLCSIISKNTKE